MANITEEQLKALADKKLAELNADQEKGVPSTGRIGEIKKLITQRYVFPINEGRVSMTKPLFLGLSTSTTTEGKRLYSAVKGVAVTVITEGGNSERAKGTGDTEDVAFNYYTGSTSDKGREIIFIRDNIASVLGFKDADKTSDDKSVMVDGKDIDKIPFNKIVLMFQDISNERFEHLKTLGVPVWAKRDGEDSNFTQYCAEMVSILTNPPSENQELANLRKVVYLKYHSFADFKFIITETVKLDLNIRPRMVALSDKLERATEADKAEIRAEMRQTTEKIESLFEKIWFALTTYCDETINTAYDTNGHKTNKGKMQLNPTIINGLMFMQAFQKGLSMEVLYAFYLNCWNAVDKGLLITSTDHEATFDPKNRLFIPTNRQFETTYVVSKTKAVADSEDIVFKNVVIVLGGTADYPKPTKNNGEGRKKDISFENVENEAYNYDHL